MKRDASRGHAAAVLVAPWASVAVFAALWLGVLVPRALEGQPVLVCLGLLAGLALACFVAAAVTFSRDVLTGRWPRV